MDVEDTNNGAAAIDSASSANTSYNADLVNCVQELLNQFRGDTRNVVSALAEGQRLSVNEAGRRVNWALANGATCFQGDDDEL